MVVREESSKRRKSIAGTSSGRASLTHKGGKRRAYSIAPGSGLSPLTKARRDLRPRKSILKVPVAILHGDDPNFTPSPDTSETQDFTTDVHDNFRRKSMGRRVSFSSTAHIRYFTKKGPRTSDAPSSEPDPEDSPPKNTAPPPPQVINDENAYPGSSNNRRRSSVGRPSFAPSDMDVTGVFDFGQPPPGDSAVEDEDSYVEDGDEDGDMDVTQGIPRDLARRQSSVAFQEPGDDSNMSIDPDATGSYMDESSGMQSDTEPLECEVPLGQALNPPVTNDAWDALAQAANAPVEGGDDEDDLEEAILRLRRASAFLPPTQGGTSEDSFTSTEDSFNADGDETMNISRAMGRVSVGGNDLARMSLGGESAMDESEVYGAIGVEPQMPAATSQAQHPNGSQFPSGSQFANGSHTQLLPASHVQQQLAAKPLSSSQSLPPSQMQAASQSQAPSKFIPAPVFRPPTLSSVTGGGANVFSTPKPGVFSTPKPGIFSTPKPGVSATPKPSVFSASTGPSTSTGPSATASAGPSASSGSSASAANHTSAVASTPKPMLQGHPSSVVRPLTKPAPFSFTPRAVSSPARTKAAAAAAARPPSPAKSTGSSAAKSVGFSAAFAPPAARPSPKKFAPEHNKSAAPAQDRGTSQEQHGSDPPAVALPEKRPRNENDEHAAADKSNPAKRAALGQKPSGSSPSQGTDKSPLLETAAGPSSASAAPAPRPLDPSRTAPFESVSANPVVQRRTSMMRRPSLSARKSMVGALPPNLASKEPATSSAVASPKKKAVVGMGRASMGAAPRGGVQFQPRRPSVGLDKGKGRAVVQEEQPTQEDEDLMEIEDGQEEHGSAEHSLELDLSRERNAGPSFEDQDMVGVDAQRMQDWVDGVEQDNLEEEDIPQISIRGFFEMTGIKFIDEMIAPRRSIAPRQARPADSIPLHEYLTALAIDLPQLDLYGRVAGDLAEWNAKYKENFEEMERDAALDMPELFGEYMRAEPEDQEDLKHYLTLIKANARMQAKSDWYSWKTKWVEELTGIAQQELDTMQADLETINALNASLEITLPELERQHEEVTAQLAKEQAEIDEIQESDQDWLNQLKAEMAEQSTVIRSLETEVAQVRSGRQHVQERLDEYEAEKREHAAAIASANRMLDVRERRTHSEVQRLQAELESLEDLHQFHLRTVTSDTFEYEYLQRYLVTVPLRASQPVVQGVDIKDLPGRPAVRDDFPRYTALVLATAKRRITEGSQRSLPDIVQTLRAYFFSCKELRSQLGLITVKYPVELNVIHEGNQSTGFMATAIVLFKSVRAKAFVSFIFANDVFAKWPYSIKDVQVKVDVAYGKVDPQLLSVAVTSRLAQATPQDNYACLLDACIQAQEQYPAE